MPNPSVFISHASADDAFVKSLRQALEFSGLRPWADSRELAPGDLLQPEIETAIRSSSAFVVVVSGNTFRSKWVKKELDFALALQKECGPDAYRLVPLLLDEQTVGALTWMFPEEPVAVQVSTRPGGLQEAMNEILVALRHRLPDDQSETRNLKPETEQVDELILFLEAPEIYTGEGLRRGKARARLSYRAASGGREQKSQPFDFMAPLGPIEAGDLRWYLEEYSAHPFEHFVPKAAEIAAKIPLWGGLLFQALTGGDPGIRDVLNNWLRSEGGNERRFTIEMDAAVTPNTPAETRLAALEAAALLLSLPWEILHDGTGYLFQGRRPARVRRLLPSRQTAKAIEQQPLLRVLLLSPRPETEQVGYIDHRVSPRALFDAVEPLGALVELKVLETPTFPAMAEALREADAAGRPFTAVHFDGHGVFDPIQGLGALCFESNARSEQEKTEFRALDLVHADRLAAELRGYRIPLFFLDACQTAQVKDNPTASVAATLLEQGVAAVAAMSHSVLVNTAGRFAEAFYRSLATGAKIGSAMLAGQKALHADPHRGDLPGGKKLELQDWFVPVLFQEENDPALVPRQPSARVREEQKHAWKTRLGADVPDEPAHRFVGRSRELLRLERHLRLHPWAVLRGQGGAGKTTLAAEFARWSVRTRQFERAVFLSFDPFLKTADSDLGAPTDVRGAMDALGRQLLPEQPDWSVAKYRDEAEAWQHLDRALRNRRTLVVLDNLESILPDHEGKHLPGVAQIADFEAFFKKISDAAEHTRLLFTSRESLPGFFARGDRELRLGALSRFDALALLAQVMRTEGGGHIGSENVEDLEATFGALAQAANYHARALTLLARQIAQQHGGLRGLTADLSRLMVEMERKYPGDRENSLFASVELSLRRLPPGMRDTVEALAVFHGGADVYCWTQVAECSQEDIAPVAMALVQCGLAELKCEQSPFFFQIDPALPAWMLLQSDPASLPERRARWAQSIAQLTGFLYQQHSKDVHLVTQLSRLEEQNLLAMLGWMLENAAPEQVVDLANQVEGLFSYLARPGAMSRAIAVREKSTAELGEWSHARFLAESTQGERLLEQGNLPTAYEVLKRVWEQCRAAGETAYPEAGDDAAISFAYLARVLRTNGQAEQALPLFQEAHERFLALAQQGDEAAGRMASVCLAEMGDCYLDLGQLEEAANIYEELVEDAKKRGDLRDLAADKSQLATVRLYQKRSPDALALYDEAQELFEQMGEAKSVATIWHQKGIAYQEIGQGVAAEKAYSKALAIRIRERLRDDEAATLNQLGTLYHALNRLAEAVQMHKKAASIYQGLGNGRKEGAARSNLANALIQLRRYAEARPEILRAIECKSPFGHAAEPWTTWATLHHLEIADGQPAAAAEARGKAMQAYRAYRAQGGVSQSNGYQLIEVTDQAIQQGQAEALVPELRQVGEGNVPLVVKVLVRQLLAVLGGSRSPALADDPELDFMDAVELGLLLEGI